MKCRVTALVLSSMLVASAALVGGCARREHIRSDYGEPSAVWWQAQAQATERDQARGLDSEEAAMIHGNYRRNIGGGARTQDQSQVLILEEPGNARSRR